MIFEKLKTEAEKIKMTDDMQNRIIRNCKVRENKTEVFFMKKTNYKKLVAVAVVVVVLLSISVSAIATDGFGIYKEKKNLSGAIVGGVYEQATNEIQLKTLSDGDFITVNATILEPDRAPYSSFDTIRVGVYRIVDSDGAVVSQGEGTERVVITDGAFEVKIPFEGNGYKLWVDSFVGESKADQLLEIKGEWECVISK